MGEAMLIALCVLLSILLIIEGVFATMRMMNKSKYRITSEIRQSTKAMKLK